MSAQERSQVNELMAQIEEMWGHLDTLFNELGASNGWEQKHGPDWTFADVPYHLAYCNRDLIARGIELGADYPEDERELLASVEAMNDWNAREFSRRPAGQTAAQSVSQWRASCEEIRKLTSRMTDDDLDGPFWMPLFRGWAEIRTGLDFIHNHDWGEFMQLRIHMGREEPVPSSAITKAYLGTMLQIFPMNLDRGAAQGQHFTVIMDFMDPGVGAYTIEVTQGSASLKEGEALDPDLVMTQSSETFAKTINGILNPAEAIQSGLIQVNNFESLATFGKLFPMG